MITFARSIKEELVHIKGTKEEKLALVSALLHINGELLISSEGMRLVFKSNNHAIARHFIMLIKELYSAEMEVSLKENSFKKTEISVTVFTKTQEIVSEVGLLIKGTSDYELLTQSINTKQAYLRGAFLASGSINDPITANYHLEIYTSSKENIVYLQQIANTFNLNSKITKRRNGFILYLKEAEAISEFLKIIGAYEGVFRFEELRIQRDFTNSINRIINCEIANEKKTLKAATNQLNQITFIKEYRNIDVLDKQIIEIMELREENPEASLNELAIAYEEKTGESISKSGINHRLQKIKALAIEIAKSLRDQEEDVD